MVASLSKRIIVTKDGVIRYYWRWWGSFLFTFLLALGFMVIFVFTVVEALLIPQCFVLMTLLISLGLFYITIGFAINYTEFRVAGGELLLHYKPLPWWGNVSIPAPGIERINIGLDVGESETGERSATGYYLVSAIERKDGKGRTRLLISGLSLENADVLSWEFENVLGISHHPDREKRISSLRERLTKYNSRQKRKIALDSSKIWTILLIVFFLIGMLFAFIGKSESQEWRASQGWPSVTGKVTDVQIVSDIYTDGTEYTPVVTYQYSVNGILYTSQRVRIEAPSGHLDPNNARRAVSEYAPNKPVTVYYDPAQPERALLDRTMFGNVYFSSGIIFIVISGIGTLLSVWSQKRNRKKSAASKR